MGGRRSVGFSMTSSELKKVKGVKAREGFKADEVVV
jgi:hypothetical protein